MMILAADTGTSILGVAVCDENRILAETTVFCGRAHSERFLETMDWVLRESGATLGDIDLLAIGIGPGSFTGLRVGAAAMKGLALGYSLPLMGVPSLDAMARLAVFGNATVMPLLDAKMSEVFGAIYTFNNGIRTKHTPDMVCPIEKLLGQLDAIESHGGVYVLGDGATRYAEAIRTRVPEAVFLPPPCNIPRASAIAYEAAERLAAGAPADAASVAPVYLRKSQAEEAREAHARSGSKATH